MPIPLQVRILPPIILDSPLRWQCKLLAEGTEMSTGSSCDSCFQCWLYSTNRCWAPLVLLALFQGDALNRQPRRWQHNRVRRSVTGAG